MFSYSSIGFNWLAAAIAQVFLAEGISFLFVRFVEVGTAMASFKGLSVVGKNGRCSHVFVLIHNVHHLSLWVSSSICRL